MNHYENLLRQASKAMARALYEVGAEPVDLEVRFTVYAKDPRRKGQLAKWGIRVTGKDATMPEMLPDIRDFGSEAVGDIPPGVPHE